MRKTKEQKIREARLAKFDEEIGRIQERLSLILDSEELICPRDLKMLTSVLLDLKMLLCVGEQKDDRLVIAFEEDGWMAAEPEEG